MGPTPGSRATAVSRVHPGLGRGGPRWAELTVVTTKIPFSAFSNRGKGSWKRQLGNMMDAFWGRFFSLGALSIAKGFSSKKRLVAFHKIWFPCKISGHHKNYAKKERFGFVFFLKKK